MYTYSFTQWLTFFMIYSFLGWVWESCYVSVKQKKWVNRGFMHGPLLPIYGSGAVIVLLAALPFKGNVFAVYIAGMFSATILEYCTGACMEAIFKVRYWDYSNRKFNLNGHICLFCSLGWGFFSIAMVYWLHKPFERMVLMIPDNVLTPVLYIVMMIAAADFAISFKTAIELRDVLVMVEKAKNEVKLLQRRMEIYEAFFEDEMMHKKEKYEGELREFADSLREKKETLSEMGEEKRELVIGQMRKEKEELQQRLSGVKDRISDRTYIKPEMRRLLKANPGAISMKYRYALDEIKSGIREKMEEVKEEVKEKTEEVKEKLHK